MIKAKTVGGQHNVSYKRYLQNQKMKEFADFEIGDPKVYILVDGLLSVEASDVYGDALETHQIRPGDAFGYSDYLKIKVNLLKDITSVCRDRSTWVIFEFAPKQPEF